jgi:hypothetical protein
MWWMSRRAGIRSLKSRASRKRKVFLFFWFLFLKFLAKDFMNWISTKVILILLLL